MQNEYKLFRISYINKFDYIHDITAVIILNKMNKLTVKVNNSELELEILKQNIIELKQIPCKNLAKKKSIKSICMQS